MIGRRSDAGERRGGKRWLGARALFALATGGSAFVATPAAQRVVVAGNRIQAVGQASAVVANGRYYDRAELDRLLADVQAKGKADPQPLGEAR